MPSPSSACSDRERTRSDSAWRSSTRALGVGYVQGFFAEFVGTFILVFVIFGVIHRKAPGGFAGLAIGFVVFAAIIPVAPATSAAINPARVVGPMLVLQVFGGTVKWEQLPVYVLAEVMAGIAAGLIYVVVSRTRADSATGLPTVASTESRVLEPVG